VKPFHALFNPAFTLPISRASSDSLTLISYHALGVPSQQSHPSQYRSLRSLSPTSLATIDLQIPRSALHLTTWNNLRASVSGRRPTRRPTRQTTAREQRNIEKKSWTTLNTTRMRCSSRTFGTGCSKPVVSTGTRKMARPPPNS
jgi:hypothetical protein